MKVVLIFQKYTQTLENNFKNAGKKILRKRAVLTLKADYNGMATSNQGFFPPIISTFVFLNCDEKKSLGFQTKAFVNESYCDLSKKHWLNDLKN